MLSYDFFRLTCFILTTESIEDALVFDSDDSLDLDCEDYEGVVFRGASQAVMNFKRKTVSAFSVISDSIDVECDLAY